MGRFSLFLVRQLRRRKFPVSPEAGTRPKFLEDSCGASPSVPRLPGTAAPGSRAVLGEGRAARCPARGPQPWRSEGPPVRRHQPGSGAGRARAPYSAPVLHPITGSPTRREPLPPFP